MKMRRYGKKFFFFYKRIKQRNFSNMETEEKIYAIENEHRKIKEKSSRLYTFFKDPISKEINKEESSLEQVLEKNRNLNDSV